MRAAWILDTSLLLHANQPASGEAVWLFLSEVRSARGLVATSDKRLVTHSPRTAIKGHLPTPIIFLLSSIPCQATTTGICRTTLGIPWRSAARCFSCSPCGCIHLLPCLLPPYNLRIKLSFCGRDPLCDVVIQM